MKRSEWKLLKQDNIYFFRNKETKENWGKFNSKYEAFKTLSNFYGREGHQSSLDNFCKKFGVDINSIEIVGKSKHGKKVK